MSVHVGRPSHPSVIVGVTVQALDIEDAEILENEPRGSETFEGGDWRSVRLLVRH